MFNQYNINAQRAARFGIESVTGSPLFHVTDNHGTVQVFGRDQKVLDRFTWDEWRQILAEGERSESGPALVINW
jgi:hypothetical protein